VPQLAPHPRALPGGAVPRLLSGLDQAGAPVGLDEHLARWGPVSWGHAQSSLLDDLEASGLAGHGGAWFPVSVKWRSVRGGLLKRPVVVANAAEGEPASSKDELLMARLPHLVLDGASAAGAALGAGRVIVYAPGHLVASVEHGGLQEILSKNDYGFLIATHDIKALSEKAVYFLKNHQQARKVALTGRERIAQVSKTQTIAREIEILLS